jgi:hypothetical protein
MMLRTYLNFYPDVGRDARVELGALFFSFNEKTGERFVWFEPAQGSLVAAQSQTNDKTLRPILTHFQRFVDSIVAQLKSPDVKTLAGDFLASLPQNFRHNKVTPYPDADFLSRLLKAYRAASVYSSEEASVAC